jgi:hypothetical protein
MNGVLVCVDWQLTVPAWLIEETALSELHVPCTRV